MFVQKVKCTLKYILGISLEEMKGESSPGDFLHIGAYKRQFLVVVVG